jgi:hypothetical protein
MSRFTVFFFLCGISLLWLSSCANGTTRHEENIAVSHPESFRTENVEPFNDRIEEAERKGETWPRDPILIVFNLLRISSDEARTMSMTKESSPAENPDRVTLSIFREGLLDDSIRGDWHYFELRKTNNRGWRVTAIRRAFLCRRGSQVDKMGGEPCR